MHGFMHIFIYSSIHPLLYPSIHTFIYSSLHPSIHISFHSPIYPLICLSFIQKILIHSSTHLTLVPSFNDRPLFYLFSIPSPVIPLYTPSCFHNSSIYLFIIRFICSFLIPSFILICSFIHPIIHSFIHPPSSYSSFTFYSLFVFSLSIYHL